MQITLPGHLTNSAVDILTQFLGQLVGLKSSTTLSSIIQPNSFFFFRSRFGHDTLSKVN